METEEKERLALLLEEVKLFPRAPGVYIMSDESKEIIYIGKAKNLYSRARTYFIGGDGRYQIEFLMKRVHAIRSILTDTEAQAFILERDLINKHKPRYNIRLKDDKAYLSIRIDQNKDWPKLDLVRSVQQDGANYFGPYRFGYEVRNLLDIVNRAVPLRTCSDTVFYNRQRPCLEYQMKRCAGPCCLEVDKDQYQGWVKEAISFLDGKTEKLVENFTQDMQRASEDLRFEDAAIIRDRIQALENFQQGQRYISTGTENRDVFVLYREELFASVSLLKVRNGRIADTENFDFRNVVIDNEEILETVLLQYYEKRRDVAGEILLPIKIENEDFVRQFIEEKTNAKISIEYPKRGLKYRLLQLALINAQQHYQTTFDADSRLQEAAKGLARMLGLNQIPRRIECIDISHFQGSDTVGALVCFYDGRPFKKGYKRYKVSQDGKPDDFASIHEVVRRRLERGFRSDDLPDLLIVDGGKGQLSAAIEARDNLGIDLEIVGLAKVRKRKKAQGGVVTTSERIFLEGESEAIILDAHSDVTHFVVRMRDEVHRYVITYHRSQRGKRVFQSSLDNISGIGPERRRRLLKHFGSIEKIRSASAEEIATVGRCPLPLAEKVLRELS